MRTQAAGEELREASRATQAALAARLAAVQAEASEELAMRQAAEAKAWQRWSSELHMQQVEQQKAEVELREVTGELRNAREEAVGRREP